MGEGERKRRCISPESDVRRALAPLYLSLLPLNYGTNKSNESRRGVRERLYICYCCCFLEKRERERERKEERRKRVREAARPKSPYRCRLLFSLALSRERPLFSRDVYIYKAFAAHYYTAAGIIVVVVSFSSFRRAKFAV